MQERDELFLKKYKITPDEFSDTTFLLPSGKMMPGVIKRRGIAMSKLYYIGDLVVIPAENKDGYIAAIINRVYGRSTTVVYLSKDPAEFMAYKKLLLEAKEPSDRCEFIAVKTLMEETKFMDKLLPINTKTPETVRIDIPAGHSRIFEADTKARMHQFYSDDFSLELEDNSDYKKLEWAAKRAKELSLNDYICRQNLNNHKPSEHGLFKRMKRRMPFEHPYLYYGIEIELEFPSNDVNKNDIAETMIKASGGLFTASRDGSLNNGIEFYTRPMSYLALTAKETKEKLDKFFETARQYGITNVSQRTASMHIHVSNEFFENAGKDPEAMKANMAWTVEYFRDTVSGVVGREPNGYCRKMYERLIMNDIDQYTEIHVRKGRVPSHHYDAVTMGQTGKTLEIRLFAPPFDTEHMLAMVEFVRNLAHASREEDLEGRTLGEILSSKSSPHLDAYLKRINVNTYNTEKLKNTLKIS